jgi:hypothetical protein
MGSCEGKTNRKKHGIGFELAASIFRDLMHFPFLMGTTVVKKIVG